MAHWHGDRRSTLAPWPSPRVGHKQQLGLSGLPTLPVQVFGHADSRPTQKALRFFRERRMPVSFVNLAQRPIAPTELRRFTSRLGAASVMDVDSRAYRDLGLGYMILGDEEILERLIANQRLLRLPLVRAGDRIAVGDDEKAWRELVVPGR